MGEREYVTILPTQQRFIWSRSLGQLIHTETCPHDNYSPNIDLQTMLEEVDPSLMLAQVLVRDDLPCGHHWVLDWTATVSSGGAPACRYIHAHTQNTKILILSQEEN